MNKMQRILNISGGKDSTAMYLLALERGRKFRAVFADTGWEAQATYDYIAELPHKTGGPPIETFQADLSQDVIKKRERLPDKWRKAGISEERIQEALDLLVPSGNPFLDACMTRGGFPSFHHRFCTDILKTKVIAEQVYEPVLNASDWIVSWQGVRRDESSSRKDSSRRETRCIYNCDFHVFRPLVDWTLQMVLDQHARHGLKPNPLYSKGAERVGCFPCIFSRKTELRMIAKIRPEIIDKIARWEELVSKVSRGENVSTFFMARDLKIPGPIRYDTHGIKAKVEWAATDRGGKQLPMFDRPSVVHEEWKSTCFTHGACE